MILVHLSVNGKAAIISPELIMFAEECDGEKDGKKINFTRLYLSKPLPGEAETCFVDVQETVDRIAKVMK